MDAEGVGIAKRRVIPIRARTFVTTLAAPVTDDLNLNLSRW
jgi:hypothetical protein